jgi:hypothetical protein
MEVSPQDSKPVDDAAEEKPGPSDAEIERVLAQMSNLQKQPSFVLTRAGTMMRLTDLGLADMDSDDPDRALSGFVNMLVFGRAVTSALQNLRSFDQVAFDTWYEPWQKEMKGDPLLRYFYKLRSDILKNVSSSIVVTLAATGITEKMPGDITVEGAALPESHLGRPLTSTKAKDLAQLYVAYLRRLLDSGSPIVWQVHDKWTQSQQR